MISSTELTALRAELVRLTLPDRCAIVTPVESVQASGAFERTFVTKQADVPCRLDPVQVNPQTGSGGRTGIEDEYVLTLPWDAPVESDDRIVLGGVRYSINSLHDRHSLRAVTRARVRTERLP